jgi:GDP-L-fucose synthase
MDIKNKIYVAGHNGMVGSAIVRKLAQHGYTNLVLKSSKELDLTNQQNVADFFEKEKPEYVILCAAKVGGILANNTYRANFIYQNLMIQSNIIHHAYKTNVTKLLFLGSSCIYPKMATQPIKEEYLLTGELEPTNEPYAIAKIAGLKMCEAYYDQYNCNFISTMPTNLYGPNDNFDLHNSHVLPALLKKFHLAKTNNSSSVEIWGTGKPLREFLHVDDLADACYFLLKNYNDKKIVNVGTGSDISILELANLIKNIVGYTGKLIFDHSKPDGTPKKQLDVSLLHSLGWKHSISIEQGIVDLYSSVKDKLI